MLFYDILIFIRFGVIEDDLVFFFEGLIIFEVILKKCFFFIDFEIFDGVMCFKEYVVSIF